MLSEWYVILKIASALASVFGSCCFLLCRIRHAIFEMDVRLCVCVCVVTIKINEAHLKTKNGAPFWHICVGDELCSCFCYADNQRMIDAQAGITQNTLGLIKMWLETSNTNDRCAADVNAVKYDFTRIHRI